MSEHIDSFPHCDSRILHKRGECEYCDGHPGWQELREAWGIAFTGHLPKAALPKCGEHVDQTGFRCKQAMGHEGPHMHMAEWERTPCPADAARPPGSSSDHRRWGGNTATSDRGDSSQPRQTLASVIMYGDQGGRRDWPLAERIALRLRKPYADWRKRRQGFVREGDFWVKR